MIYGGHFDLDNKINRRDELDKVINSVDFWNSNDKDDVLKEFNSLNNIINEVNGVKNKIDSNIELLGEEIDNDMFDLINEEYESIRVHKKISYRRELQNGIGCPKCGCVHHYWKKNRNAKVRRRKRRLSRKNRSARNPCAKSRKDPQAASAQARSSAAFFWYSLRPWQPSRWRSSSSWRPSSTGRPRLRAIRSSRRCWNPAT